MHNNEAFTGVHKSSVQGSVNKDVVCFFDLFCVLNINHTEVLYKQSN